MMKNTKNIFRENKKGLAITNKSFYAIFLVLFVLFVFFILVGGRVDRTEQDVYYDLYDHSYNLMQSILSNPNCIIVGNQVKSEDMNTAVQGLLDVNKLVSYDGMNEDLWCVENYDLLYSVDVRDEYKNSWHVGLLEDDPIWADRNIKISLPVIVRFDNGICHSGLANFRFYSGIIPKFYGSIKKACVSGNDQQVSIDTDYDIRYVSDNNSFYVDDEHFYPYFSCNVNDFFISEGKHIVYIGYDGGQVNVKI